jgi:hypothetical protein
MPKPDEVTTPPVRPPTLPPDFPDIPQNPSSELQRPPEPSATSDVVAGTTLASESQTREGRTKDELRDRNARLREKINSALEQHPELRDATEELTLEQGLHVEVGTPFLERINGKLQERARAIIERRPDLERLFDDEPTKGYRTVGPSAAGRGNVELDSWVGWTVPVPVSGVFTGVLKLVALTRSGVRHRLIRTFPK